MGVINCRNTKSDLTGYIANCRQYQKDAKQEAKYLRHMEGIWLVWVLQDNRKLDQFDYKGKELEDKIPILARRYILSG